MPDISPQQRIDPLLSKSGILKGLLWGGGSLLLTILGNFITQWLYQQLPNSTWHNIFVSSRIDSSWLPPISLMIASLIIGFIAYLIVHQAQNNADKRIDAMWASSAAAERDKSDLQKQIEVANYNKNLWQKQAEKAENGLKKAEQDLTSKQSELDRAKEELDEVNVRFKKAIEDEQIRTKQEIREIQNDALQRIQKAEQEVVLARADGLEAIEVTKDGNKQIIREIEHNYEKKNAQLVADCQYLLDQNQQLKSNMLDGPGSTHSQWSDFANAAPIRQENLDDARITAIRNRLQKQIK